jgi:UDP-N-acetylglucosamine 2-epimerase (non-hydrolysing)
LKKLLFIFGTRPEAIKMAPLILEAKKRKAFEVSVCITGQHREMLDQVMDFFELKADHDLNIMQPGQTLEDITAACLQKLQPVLQKISPDFVFVQGDTTTAFVAALAAFYQKIKVVHIEAGLRSNDKFSPFPEEINRKLISSIADLHFCPTETAKENLLKENFKDGVYTTGNTVIDALLIGKEKVISNEEIAKHYSFLRTGSKIILITGHRRESFGEPFKNIFEAYIEIAKRFPEIDIVYPVHLNPNVKDVAFEMLQQQTNIHLLPPVAYPHLIWLMNKADIIITDSGGIQEEAPTLGKPVLVTRTVTERTEGIDAGTAKLVGADKQLIIDSTVELLTNKNAYNKMANAVNPYGDGTASKQILDIIASYQ